LKHAGASVDASVGVTLFGASGCIVVGASTIFCDDVLSSRLAPQLTSTNARSALPHASP